jgi:hypothetical protein
MREYKLENQEFIFEVNGQKYSALWNIVFDCNEVLEVNVHSLIDYDTEQLLTRLEPNFMAWARAEDIAQLKAKLLHNDYFQTEWYM